MRLLIISNYFYPEIGAAPNRIYNLAEGLSKHHDVEIIAPLPNYPHGKIAEDYKGKFSKIEWLDKIKIYRYFIYPSKSRNAIVRIFSMLSFSLCLWFSVFHLKKKKQIDAVIIQNSPLLVSFSAIILFKKLLRRNIVLNVSDLWPDSALDLGYVSEGRFYNLLKRIEQFNYRNSKAIAGQSQEILDHITQDFKHTPTFLYRNVQPEVSFSDIPKHSKFSIVYAGLLGVAQGLLEILQHINFNEYDLQFHIYGDGAEKDDILKLIEEKDLKNINYKGMVTKKELTQLLPSYHFALVPLTTHIKGAVPSKIFELVSCKVPVIYMGSGEAAEIIKTYQLGYSAPPKDYKKLKVLLEQISNITPEDYKSIQANCEKASKTDFNFNKQLESFNTFLKTI